jgi:hypothetical protein
MPQPHRPPDDADSPPAEQRVVAWPAEHRGELIVEELVRADQAYWQRAGSVDAMLRMVP